RAFLEGIAHGANHVLDTYAEAGEVPRSLFAVGGGTQNRIWSQSISDMTARSQILREITIGAAFGDALLAALAIGAAIEADIGRWNPVAGEIRPDPSTAEVHARNGAVYRALYPATRALMHRLG